MKHDLALAVPQTSASDTGVFIDADNLSSRHAEEIVGNSGRAPRILRAYGNAATAKGWEQHPAVQFIHTGTGKNASDIALAVDAMDTVHRFDLKKTMICSSDGDFRHLALTLRAHGTTVIGSGEKKAPMSFRSACSEWTTLDTKRACSDVAVGPLSDEDLNDRLRRFIRENSKQGRGVEISRLNRFVMSELQPEDGTVGGRWRNCLEQKDRFAIDRRDQSGAKAKDPMVRFLPEGFPAPSAPLNAPLPSCPASSRQAE